MAILVSKIVKACAAPTKEGKDISRNSQPRPRVGKLKKSVANSFLLSGACVTDPVLGDGTASYTPGVSVRSGGNVRYQHTGLKNTDSQTSMAQSVAASRIYDAFGIVVSSSGTWTGPFGYAGNFGYQQDASGLKLLGHRYYDPSTGRFLTRDPIKDGRNWYAYGAGEAAPTTTADPTGLRWIITLAADGSHAWIVITCERTGSQTSYGRWGKDPLPYAGKTGGGIHVDGELGRGADQSRSWRSEAETLWLPSLTDSEYCVATNNCVDFAIEFIERNVGVSPNGGILPGTQGLDTPWGIRRWIYDQNRRSPTGVATPPNNGAQTTGKASSGSSGSSAKGSSSTKSSK